MANQHHSTKCGRATAGFTPRPGFDYFNHDQIIATTVVAIVAVASQPMICSAGVRVNPAMTVRRVVINIIVTINGTATTPFRTALQESALIGSIGEKFTATPNIMPTAIVA